MILFCSGTKGDTRRYRVFHPYEQLRLAGVDCMLSHVTDRDLPHRIAQAKIVIFHRITYDHYIHRLFQMIQDRDILAIMDIDDLVFDPTAMQWIASPDFQDPVRAALYQEDMCRNRRALEMCRAAITSTSYLAGQIIALGMPVWVHRNAFSLEMLELSEKTRKDRQDTSTRIIIGYACGTPTHDRDFASVKPALEYILHRYSQTELHIFGRLNPGHDWEVPAERIQRHAWVPWRRLPTYLAGFDINIAPILMDNPFGQSKSEIKYVESGLVRVPTIASPTEAYEFAIRPGENGYLSANDKEWIDALSELIENPEARKEIGKLAYDDTLNHYHPAVRARDFISTINQIYQYFTGKFFWPDQDKLLSKICHLPKPINWPEFYILPGVEHNPSFIKRGLYSLRHRGIWTLFKQIWIFIRRLAVPLFPFRTRPG
jgi:glycosyltransferase involved in cell wall biosynthesis